MCLDTRVWTAINRLLASLLWGPNTSLFLIALGSNLTAPIDYAREGQDTGEEFLCETQRKRASQPQEMKKELFLSRILVLLWHKILGSTTELWVLLCFLSKVTLITARVEISMVILVIPDNQSFSIYIDVFFHWQFLFKNISFPRLSDGPVSKKLFACTG